MAVALPFATRVCRSANDIVEVYERCGQVGGRAYGAVYAEARQVVEMCEVSMRLVFVPGASRLPAAPLTNNGAVWEKGYPKIADVFTAS